MIKATGANHLTQKRPYAFFGAERADDDDDVNQIAFHWSVLRSNSVKTRSLSALFFFFFFTEEDPEDSQLPAAVRKYNVWHGWIGNKHHFWKTVVKETEVLPITVDQSANSTRFGNLWRSLSAQRSSEEGQKWYSLPSVNWETSCYKLTLLDSFCFAFMAMNFSSHAAAWALRTTFTKFPFCCRDKKQKRKESPQRNGFVHGKTFR